MASHGEGYGETGDFKAIIEEVEEYAPQFLQNVRTQFDAATGRGEKVERLIAAGKVFEACQRWPQAAEAYRTALADESSADEALARLALVHLKSGSDVQGLRLAAELAHRAPDAQFKTIAGGPYSSQTVLGDALFVNGDADQALAAYQRAKELDKGDIRAGTQLVRLFLEDGELDEAARATDDANFSFERDLEKLTASLSLRENDPRVLPAVTNLRVNSVRAPVV